MSHGYSVELIEFWDGEAFVRACASDYFSETSEKEVDRLRVAIPKARYQGQQVLARCGLCGTSLYIRRRNDFERGLIHFFQHHHSHDDQLQSKGCPQHASSPSLPLSVIRAFKYQGAQESALHRHLKACIYDVLMSDSSVPNESVLVEKRLKNSEWWRRPDVQADIRGTTVAFEVQVSTEFISMIVMREWFYESCDSAAILWVLPSFDPQELNSSQRDILTRNNDHLFVLSSDMIEHSIKERSLLLECWIHFPEIDENRVLVYRWDRRVVGLDDIQFVNGHAQVVDVMAIEQRLKHQLGVLPFIPDKTLPAGDPDLAAKGRGALLQLSPKVDALYRDWSSLYERIADHPPHWMAGELALSEYTDLQSRYIVGIWLKSRGIDLREVGCDQPAIKALASADKNELLWSNQGWKWATNLIVINHSKWLRPYHKLISTAELDDYDYKNHCKADSRLRSALVRARDQKPLSQHEKAFLAIICPRLGLPLPERVPLTDAHEHGLSYQVVKEGRSLGSSKLYSPEFPYYQKFGVAANQARLIESLEIDIERSVSHSLSQGYWIPMPNLQTSFLEAAGFLQIGRPINVELVDRLTDQLSDLSQRERLFI